MPTEVEARFRVSDPGALRQLAAAARLGAATLGPARTFDEIDVYLDTADGALGAARWACRLRRRGERVTVSLKGPPDVASGGWLHRRPEVEGPATAVPDPATWPASAARDLLDRLRAGRPLAERLTLEQRRTERQVVLAGDRVGVLSLDEVTIRHLGERRGDLAIVELELRDGPRATAAVLADLAGELATVVGLLPEPRSKLERALALIATP